MLLFKLWKNALCSGLLNILKLWKNALCSKTHPRFEIVICAQWKNLNCFENGTGFYQNERQLTVSILEKKFKYCYL